MAIFLPERPHSAIELADAAADRRRARQVRRRPGQGQARGGDRAPQPDSPAAAPAGDGRGSHAEEHPDDRADRRRQDGDRAAARAAGAVAVHQGRGVEVHRGRLRRPRRRVDGARPGRARRRHGARREGRRGARQGARTPPKSGCSTCCCRRARPPAARRRHRGRASRRAARASACASSCAKGASTSASSRSTCATRRCRPSRSSPGSSVEEIGINLKDMMGNCSRGGRRRGGCKVPEALRASRRRGAGEAGRHGVGEPHRRSARRAVRHHLHRRDRQDCEPRRDEWRRRTART